MTEVDGVSRSSDAIDEAFISRDGGVDPEDASGEGSRRAVLNVPWPRQRNQGPARFEVLETHIG